MHVARVGRLTLTGKDTLLLVFSHSLSPHRDVVSLSLSRVPYLSPLPPKKRFLEQEAEIGEMGGKERG